MANQFISPFNYFNEPESSKPVGLGLLYIGEPDKDPEDFPVQVYVVQPDGTDLPISQPISLSAGGVPIYEGTPVQIKYESALTSVKVTSSGGALLYYTARCDTVITAADLADPDSQVVIGGITVENIIDQITVYATVEKEGSLPAALATGLPVILKGSTDYPVDDYFVIPEKAMIIGPKSARLVSSVDGHMAEVGSRATLIGFSAVGAQPNARGLLIKAGTVLQSTSNLELTFTKEALDFELLGGSGFSSNSDTWVTTTSSLSAVRMPTSGSTESAATPRKFVNPEFGGSRGFDFGSCNDAFVSNCYTFGFTMQNNCSKVIMSNVRIGADAGTRIEVRGINHVITNCVGAVPVDVYAIDSVIDILVGNWDVNDLGTGNSIDYRDRGYTPVLSTDGPTQPNLTDSFLIGRYQREGNTVRVAGQLILSATATMGEGNLFISLPPNAEGQVLGYNQLCQGNLEKIGPRPGYLAVPVMADNRLKVGFSYTDTSGTALIEKFLGGDIVDNKFQLDAKAPTFVPDLDNAIDVYHYVDSTDVTGRIWKDVGTKTFSVALVGDNVIEITLSFAPAADDYIVVELEQPARRSMQSEPQEEWPEGTVIRWAFSYNCK